MTQEEYGIEYQRNFAKTVRALRYRGASPDRAEDSAQAAWMQGWRKLEQLRDHSALVGWINSIAINHHRRNGVRDARCVPMLDPDALRGSETDSAPIDVATILRICHPRDRTLFEWQLLGLSTQEIADQQGITPAAARLRLFRARRAARAGLQKKAQKQFERGQ